MSNITNLRFASAQLGDNSGANERIALQSPLRGFPSFVSDDNATTFVNDNFSLRDRNSSTQLFTQQASASVPFEFSPTLGLFLVGGMFAGRNYVKRRQARSLIENNR